MTETEKEVGTEGERGGSLTRLLTGDGYRRDSEDEKYKTPCTMYHAYIIRVHRCFAGVV